MKNSIHPAVIAGVLVVVVGVLGFFLFKVTSSGPTVEGVESLPPNVKAALLGENKGSAVPKKP